MPENYVLKAGINFDLNGLIMKHQRKSTISHLNVFNDNNDLGLDKKVEKKITHSAVFIINEKTVKETVSFKTDSE